MRRAGAGWCDQVDLGGKAQDQEVFGLALQLAYRLPRADHQQGVAKAQLFFHQLLFDSGLIAAQADHVKAIAGAKRQFEDALADQLRAGWQRDLSHSQILGLIDEVGGLEVQRLQLHGLAQAAQVVMLGEQVEQQHVALMQHGARVGRDHARGELVLALDTDHVGAVSGAQFQLAKVVAD